jgi:hypothetical protein
LVTACETSTAELNALERRSTGQIEMQLAGLADCATLLIRSQTASMMALRSLLNEKANFSALDAQLQQSLTLARAAEERLKRI